MNPRCLERSNTWFLTRVIARADFKVRFADSALGYFWYLLKPLLFFCVLYTVFSRLMLAEGVQHYGVRLLMGIVFWDFFASGSKIGIDAYLGKASLLSKVAFPRHIVTASANITALLTLLFNLLVLGLFMAYEGLRPSWAWVAFPLVFLPLELLLLGVSMGLGGMNVFFRDVTHIWEVVVQILFWATPIVYPVSIAPATVQRFLRFNPFSRVIEDVRAVLIDGAWPPAQELALTYCIALVVLWAGHRIFLRYEPRFSEAI